MHADVSTAFGVCLLLIASSSSIGKEGEQERQADEVEERERVRHELRVGPGETPEGPAERDPNDHINEHLRMQELLDRHPVEIPDRFEKKK